MTDKYGGLPDWVWVAPPAVCENGNWEPTEEELAAAPVLEYWSAVAEGSSIFLQGCVRGHPRLADGTFIKTAALQWLSADRAAARTFKRCYRLGVSAAEAAIKPAP